MLENSETNNPKAIEIHVCEKMNSLKRFPMDNELGMTLAQLLLIPKNGMLLKEKEKPSLCKIIELRIEHCFTFKIQDDRLILFLAAISESAGTAIMYLWFIQWWCFRNSVYVIDLNIFCQKIFPVGFFGKSDLQKVWDGQKVRREYLASDNLVDYSHAGVSIQFIKDVVL
jgi:hypothetical protein